MNKRAKDTFTRSDIEASLKKEFPNLSKSDIANAIDSISNVIINSIALDEKVEVVGYGSILIERKIRGGKMGHIEDIAVHPDFCKNGIGKLLINALYEISQKEKCYKVSLACKEHNLSFYQKCDFLIDGISLSKFL